MTNVFTNGCFDILHPGHIALFEYAASWGDRLIVGIDSDSRMEETKRVPIYNQEERKLMLNSIRYIDVVHIFNTERELSHLVLASKADIMVVGSDWENKKIIGSEYVKQVKYFERDERYSTTGTLKRIIDR